MVAMSAVKVAFRKSGFYPQAKAAFEEVSPRRRQERQRRATFYSQFVSPGSLVFDIGANMGNRADPFLRLGASVVAVEPQPLCVRTLRRRFGRHPRFTLLPIGVTDQSGQADLHLATNHVTSSMSDDFVRTMQFDASSWQETIAVRVTTFDEIINIFGIPDFAKIDVEGFEVRVLEGLSHPIEAVSFEFTPELRHNAVLCIERLRSLSSNYQFAYSPGESMEWWPYGWVDASKASQMAATSDLPFGDFYAAQR